MIPPETPVLVDLKSLLPEELRALVRQLGQDEYRAGQLLSWIHGKGIEEIDQMSDLSRAFREQLKGVARVSRLQEVERQVSPGGQAIKFLFELPTGERVESVLIIDGKRRTACLSSQVGCPLDCQFCATGRMGFLRNLSAAQITDQLLQLSRALLAERGERVTNVVMMGMGEPLLNYEELVRALRLMRLEHGPAIGGRKVTVSTAGYVPGILRLAREDLNLGLAISLNATTDELRDEIMPINRKYKIAELLAAAAEFFALRGRQVTFEYVLLAGVTDSDEDALRLAALTWGVPCKINLIPYNELGEDTPRPRQKRWAASGTSDIASPEPKPLPDVVFRRPPPERVALFRQTLEASTPMAVTLRESRGRDIGAACGQLYQAQERQRRPARTTALAPAG